jgi:hypothetical protein
MGARFGQSQIKACGPKLIGARIIKQSGGPPAPEWLGCCDLAVIAASFGSCAGPIR